MGQAAAAAGNLANAGLGCIWITYMKAVTPNSELDSSSSVFFVIQTTHPLRYDIVFSFSTSGPILDASCEFFLVSCVVK